MTLKIIHKNNTSAGQAPAPSDLDIGEIAVNSADAKLYAKDNDGAIQSFTNDNDAATVQQFTQAGTSAVQRTVQSKLQDVVSVKDFGAVGDGVTDDTAAVQAAIDYCLSKTLPLVKGQSLIPTLVVSGLHYVSSSLKIDRPVNQTNEFRIVGLANAVGGFVTDQPIHIFSTNYTGSDKAVPANSQLSNSISFENLTFGSTVTTSKAIDLTKYVRTKISNCRFNIPITDNVTNSYVQSCWIDRCFFRGITGKCLSSLDFYDVHISNCLFEVVSDICIYSGGTSAQLSVENCLSQNCGNIFVNIGTATGVNISSNYIEANADHFIKIDNARGVHISGNYVQTRALSPDNAADSTFFEVQFGECYGATVVGNYFTNRGVEITSTSNRSLYLDTSNTAGTDLFNSTADSITNTYEGQLKVNTLGIGTTPSSALVHVSGASGSAVKFDVPSAYNNYFDILSAQGRSRIRTAIDSSGGNPGGIWSLDVRDSGGTLQNAITINATRQTTFTTVASASGHGFKIDLSNGNTSVYVNNNPAGGYVGLGKVPSFQLELSTDSAGKPATDVWTIVSDERIKEDIELADLDICYQAVKDIPLKRFKWRDDVYDSEQVPDRHKLGWIAQDVQSVFPKAVNTHEFKYNQQYEETVVPAVEEELDEDGNVVKEYQPEQVIKGDLISEAIIDDCLNLNSNQIYAAMYGAIQKLIQKVEVLEAEINTLKTALG